MPCDTRTCPDERRTASPLKIAIVICAAVAAGAALGTIDASTVEAIASGRFLTAPLAEAQQRNTTAIAALERKSENFAKDLDFVVSRIGASVRRNEDQTSDRLVKLDAEIAELKDTIALMHTARLSPSRAADPLLGSERRAEASEVTGLRSSLNDLAAAHHGAVAEITKRLDRIEVMVGLSTDVVSSVADPLELKRARRKAFAERTKKLHATPAKLEQAAEGNAARPERGHLFNVKPISQQGAPLRLSRLPG
jgi:hypothetical protein